MYVCLCVSFINQCIYYNEIILFTRVSNYSEIACTKIKLYMLCHLMFILHYERRFSEAQPCFHLNLNLTYYSYYSTLQLLLNK